MTALVTTDQRIQRRLTGLSEALLAFHDDLEAHAATNEVATLMWTEFGRRVRANGSSGTDHGAAGPLFVSGGGVRGSLYGEPPSLRVLDENGDLRFTTDFRSVYASIIEQWFKSDPAAVLGGRYPQIPLFARRRRSPEGGRRSLPRSEGSVIVRVPYDAARRR